MPYCIIPCVGAVVGIPKTFVKIFAIPSKSRDYRHEVCWRMPAYFSENSLYRVYQDDLQGNISPVSTSLYSFNLYNVTIFFNFKEISYDLL